MKHPGGRPTKYKAEHATDIIKWFSVPKHTQFMKKEITIESTGRHECEYQMVASDLPTFEGFARSIGVNGDTVVEWAKGEDENDDLKYPEFSAAYKVAKDLQREFLIDNGLKGLYPPASFIFTAKNVTTMRDVQETKNETDMRFTGLEKLNDEQLDAVIKKFQNSVGQGADGKIQESGTEPAELRPSAPEAAGGQPM
jgi:hypothetical protein